MISIQVDFGAWASAFGSMKRIDLAMARGINRTVAQVNTVMVRAVGADLNIAQRVVRDRMVTLNASESRLIARIDAGLARIPLIEFNAKGANPSRGRGRGVTASLPPPGARRYPHAFKATMPKSGHEGVFERLPNEYMRVQKKGWKKKRQAIHQLFGPSIAQSFSRHADVGQARANEVLDTNLQHEITFLGM